MWTLYRNTCLRIQAVIAMATLVAFIASEYRLPAAAVFFGVMQVGAILGTMSGVRLRGNLRLR
jgi:hypothetical protein